MRQELPHSGLRVLDFGHTVMGPTAGLVLADLGAEVIRVEPAKGDPTRALKGFGTGYFPFYNRNKGSIALDLKDPRGLAVAKRLIGTADVLIENFGPGTMARLGLSYEQLAEAFPSLIYLSLKGFLPGPYENRVALDEVVQMMSGLAYMTGPPGQPLRAGASVIDVMGGVMGVVGVQAALAERERTGRGQLVTSALFESAMFLMGQHLAYAALSDAPVPPMPARVSAWAIYDQFDSADGERVFLGITSDRHWQRFCEVFDAPELAADSRLSTNNQRIEARGDLLPKVAALVAGLPLVALTEKAVAAQLPFAHVARPEQLFDDPHLAAGERLLPTELPGGVAVRLPALPVELDGRKTVLERSPPKAGADTAALLGELGYDATEIAGLAKDGVIVVPDRGETG
ncbi:CoA transferase [Roseobacter sp. HKCCD9010]|uniref:CaiB/BaiF CoA transferase family protein n=1 Tax=unclassified Roseobacter TaxID=196798 RepID=UPI001490C31D|nr:MULTISPECIES: CaiB/BaiF CoA-transferase family protein [unclassified Roseobacter]MBF9050784.1 CoA transferase [Rhodobacterales bacterium HKCCD4356]NNV11798.1 CoA transferase [Roseobacter sp. HKCCD7357]NNV17949.1 CoA transferase [Roseobacter sp. HKCCD8768]NNV26040.1 CoA transferase [Roseobacter sp. HKCCD8192]NNV31676.1 CoA transferase [Roseobacter sp. HKCCD9061]